jgi:ABC-type uncharacterized transport system involved in gliding motility auxiliary subunit
MNWNWQLPSLTIRLGIYSVSVAPGFRLFFAAQEGELRRRKSPGRSRLPATARNAAPATTPSTASGDKPYDNEQNDGTNSGIDDQSDDSNTKMDR